MSEDSSIIESDREEYREEAEKLRVKILENKTEQGDENMTKKKVKSKSAKKTISKGNKLKPIVELNNSTGWVSFTIKQMEAIGINPNIHTSKDLRKKVFDALKLKGGRK